MVAVVDEVEAFIIRVFTVFQRGVIFIEDLAVVKMREGLLKVGYMMAHECFKEIIMGYLCHVVFEGDVLFIGFEDIFFIYLHKFRKIY